MAIAACRGEDTHWNLQRKMTEGSFKENGRGDGLVDGEYGS